MLSKILSKLLLNKAPTKLSFYRNKVLKPP